MQGGDFGELVIDAVIVGDIPRDDLEKIVDLAAHPVKFDHFWYQGHAFGKDAEPIVRVMGGADGNDYGYAKPKPFTVEDRHPSIDYALPFQTLDPFPAGCHRQTDPFGDFGDRNRGILLQNG